MTDLFETANPGLFSVVKGRIFGKQDIGVTPGGPMDEFSMEIGNILLGNDAFSPALEIIYPPDVFLAKGHGCFVITGANFISAELRHFSSIVQKIYPGTVYAVHPGDQLCLGVREYGFRSYLCCTLLESGIDDRLKILPGRKRGNFEDLGAWRDPAGKIRVIRGPEHDWLESPESFISETWMTTHEMNGMGMRLSSSGSPHTVKKGDMISGAVSDGTIQMTPKGPLVLLKHRQTIGGYPRVLNVISADVDMLGQFGPGQILRFKNISLDEAKATAQAKENTLALFRKRWSP